MKAIPNRRFTWNAFFRSASANLSTFAVIAIGAAVAFAWAWPEAIVDADDRADGRFQLLLFYTRVFQLHLGLAALACAIVVVIAATGWKRATLSAFVAAALLMPFAREYVPKRPPPPATRTLRVMSMNLFANNHDAEKIRAQIDREDPDVIVACEVTDWSEAVVFAPLAQKYPYAMHPNYDNGAFVMSRVPFANERSPDGSARRPVVFSIDGRAFAMYPVHLTSPGTRTHLMRNREQTLALAAIVATERRPMMIVGDCNFTQMTGEYQRLRAAGLRSTHDLVGFGVGNTWGPLWYPRLNRFPGMRIDQMLLSRELTATTHHVGGDTGSDHRPIVAEIGFAKP